MGTTVQAILQEHFEAFAATHPLAPYQRAAAEALRDCRTAALGGHWRSCPNGHVHTAHFNSCRHRSCPLCTSLARQQWLAGWQERLLDCPHTHIVFTTPQQLIPLWRYNKQRFTGLLFHAAADALRELLADPKYLGAVPGLLAGLHTWGQALPLHIHVHLLVTWGGLTAEGAWREPTKSCLLPRRVLVAVFRGKLRAYLGKALDQGELELPPDRTAAQIRGVLNRVGRMVWNVKILERYEHGQGVVTYLARYLKGGPLSNGRLVDCRDGMVRFRYRDNGDRDESDGRGRWKTLRLPVDEFLQRLLEHVPPPSLQTVRAYGLYANSKRPVRAVARVRFDQQPEAKPVKIRWQDICVQLGRPAATVCPQCGAPLVVHGRIPPRRGGSAQQPAAAAPPPQAQPPPGQAA
jgi:hypothetical protein